MSARSAALYAIDDERDRQDQKWGWPNEGLAGTHIYKKLAILVEEVGELAQDLLNNSGEFTAHAKEELVQCAAVCFAWLESVEERGL